MRRILGVPDFVVAFVDALITLSDIVNEDDETPLVERLAAASHEFYILGQTPEWIATYADKLAKENTEDWAVRFKRKEVQTFLNKVIGTAKFHHLKKAFEEDSRTLFTAMRVGSVFIRPWALALDDTINTLTKKQLNDVNLPQRTISSFAGLFTGISA